MHLHRTIRLGRTFSLLLIMGTALMHFSCKKDEKPPEAKTPAPEPVPVGTASLSIDFSNYAGLTKVADGLSLTNNYGESYTVSRLEYYISNVVLVGDNVGNYKQPESYHLIRNSDLTGSRVQLNGVPAGRYKAIRFMFGVDSTRNVSGSQTGDLDPAYGMFWTWSTGYIMFKLEGTAPASSLSGNIIEYHLGGYKGQNKVQRTIELSLQASPLELNDNKSAVLNIKTDINTIYDSPNDMRISLYPNIVSSGNNARRMAENCEDLFTVEGWK